MPFGPGVHDSTYYIDESCWKDMFYPLRRRFLYHMQRGTWDREREVERVRAEQEEMDREGVVADGRLKVKLKNPITGKRVPPEWFADKANTLWLEMEGMMWGAWREERNAWKKRRKTSKPSEISGYTVGNTLDHIRQAGAQ